MKKFLTRAVLALAIAAFTGCATTSSEAPADAVATKAPKKIVLPEVTEAFNLPPPKKGTEDDGIIDIESGVCRFVSASKKEGYVVMEDASKNKFEVKVLGATPVATEGESYFRVAARVRLTPVSDNPVDYDVPPVLREKVPGPTKLDVIPRTDEEKHHTFGLHGYER